MFSAKREEGYISPKLNCGEGRTKQSMKDETDINLIMAKYQKTGMVNFVNKNQGEYLDVPNIDFHEAMNAIKDANNMFGDMPSTIRKRFNNDPGEFLDFVHDPANVDEIYEMGLAERPEGWVAPASEAIPETIPETPAEPE